MTASTDGTARGRCLCGSVSYRIEGGIGPFVHCHCSQCRKASGTGFTTNATIARAAFTLERGADIMRAFESSPGVRRWFCSRCGTPLWKTRDAEPATLRLRLGSLDTPIGRVADGHIWTADKADWIDLSADSRPQWPAGAVGAPPEPTTAPADAASERQKS